MPDGDVNLAADALWDLAPVHVPACLLDGPHDLAQGGHTPSDISQRNRSGLRDERVGSSSLEQLDQSGVWLVVGDEDWGEAIESASEQNCQKLEAIGQVYSNALGLVILQVLANDGDLFRDSGDVVF